MRSVYMKLTLLCFGLVFIAQMSAGISHAAIDPASIMGLWLLDEGQGSVATDSSGNGNDGEIAGAQWAEGMFEGALAFVGANHDYVAIPPSATTDDYLNAFTYALRIKPTAAPPNANTRLIERDWHNPTIQIGDAGSFYASTVVGGVLDNSAVMGGAWQIDEWSFLALTYDGAALKLYVDDEMVSEVAAGNPDITNGSAEGAIYLASWKDPGWDFTGLIDEVGVFNVALSEADIMSIVANGFENVLAGETAVSAEDKLTSTWGEIKGF